MQIRLALALLPALAACSGKPHVAPPRLAAPSPAPPFATKPYEVFSRAAAVAIALREWRLFGSLVDDDPPEGRPPPAAEDKPERAEGLWQRVGEYWWLGMTPGGVEAAWTGKHDEFGQEFAAEDDADFAWSAAFVSYVMRIAGAGPRFPYAAAHHVYIDAAAGPERGRWALVAEPPDTYAPLPGDLLCFSRTKVPLRYGDLPAGRFLAHCAIVTARNADSLDAIGGNVDDAVTLTHVPITATGALAPDPRYPWFVVLRVLYER